MGISENISGLRKMAGYSQVILASLLNVDKSTVSAWENGVRKPSGDNICALSRVLNVSFDELLGIVSAEGYDRRYGFEHRPGFTQKANRYLERGLGLKLSELREEKGMSRKEFADGLGVTPKTIRNWELKGMPKLKIYQILFEILELDAEAFQNML